MISCCLSAADVLFIRSDIQARLAVLRVCTKSVPLHPDVCLQDLAAQSELFSGADLANLCKEVKRTLTLRHCVITLCSVTLDSSFCVSGGSSGSA